MIIRQWIATSVVVATLLLVILASSNVFAQQACCGSTSANTGAGVAAQSYSTQGTMPYRAESQRTAPAWAPPHGGQIFKSIWNNFEVVYGPQETRVYVYDIFHNAQATRGLQGSAILRVRSNRSEFRYPLRDAGVGRDYLVMQVDLTHVRNGDMDVYFDLTNLPNSEQSTVRFAQSFTMNASMRPAMNSMARADTHSNHAGHQNHGEGHGTVQSQPSTAVAKATSADQPAIERQRVCPVTGSALNEDGMPLKVSVGGRSLFVCCQGCVDTVLKDPDVYFRKVARAGTPNP